MSQALVRASSGLRRWISSCGRMAIDWREQVVSAVQNKPTVGGHRLHEDTEDDIRSAGGGSHGEAMDWADRGESSCRGPQRGQLCAPAVSGMLLFGTGLLCFFILLLVSQRWATDVDRPVREQLRVSARLPQEGPQLKEALNSLGEQVEVVRNASLMACPRASSQSHPWENQ